MLEPHDMTREQLIEEVEQLRAALRPFADEGEHWPVGMFDGDHKPFNGDITIADFRRARATLADTGQGR